MVWFGLAISSIVQVSVSWICPNGFHMGFEICYVVAISRVSWLGKISLLRTSALAIWTVESFCELAMGHLIMGERKSIRGKVIWYGFHFQSSLWRYRKVITTLRQSWRSVPCVEAMWALCHGTRESPNSLATIPQTLCSVYHTLIQISSAIFKKSASGCCGTFRIIWNAHKNCFLRRVNSNNSESFVIIRRRLLKKISDAIKV